MRIRFSRSIEEKKIKTDFFYFLKYYKSCASYSSVTCRWGASHLSSRTTRTSTASSALRTRLPPSAPSARTSSPAAGSPSGTALALWWIRKGLFQIWIGIRSFNHSEFDPLNLGGGGGGGRRGLSQ